MRRVAVPAYRRSGLVLGAERMDEEAFIHTEPLRDLRANRQKKVRKRPAWIRFLCLIPVASRIFAFAVSNDPPAGDILLERASLNGRRANSASSCPSSFSVRKSVQAVRQRGGLIEEVVNGDRGYGNRRRGGNSPLYNRRHRVRSMQHSHRTYTVSGVTRVTQDSE